MKPVILVGRCDGIAHRDRLWAYVRRYWQKNLGWPICEGNYEEKPFCLAAASNLASTNAGDWDVALYTAADAVPGSIEQVLAAVQISLEKSQLVYPHDHYYSVSDEGTERILAGEEPHGNMAEWPAWPNTYSTMFVVPRTLWDAVGGWDERFVEYGFEDFAFWSACWARAGGFDRVTGPIFHLHHDRPYAEREGNPSYMSNKALCQRYMDVRTSWTEILKILQEPGAPLS